MPSFLVSINGGMARVTQARADQVEATVITPLDSGESAAPAAGGCWS
jgi:hypothetical protein